jgi:hypothetical protein
MDLTPIEASITTAIVSLGTVAAFLHKYLPRAYHYLKVARMAIETLEDVCAAAEDDNITPEEVIRIKADIVKFKELLKQAK